LLHDCIPGEVLALEISKVSTGRKMPAVTGYDDTLNTIPTEPLGYDFRVGKIGLGYRISLLT
jgi:hypothetical protein